MTELDRNVLINSRRINSKTLGARAVAFFYYGTYGGTSWT